MLNLVVSDQNGKFLLRMDHHLPGITHEQRLLIHIENDVIILPFILMACGSNKGEGVSVSSGGRWGSKWSWQ